MNRTINDNVGAFCMHDTVYIEGASSGPLVGLRFAAKDIFDIAGRTACCGNPDWLASHPPATSTAPVVQRLLDAGATLVGMTVTEELVMGLTGENPFYGAPINVAAPGRVCGGSSSGSAAAVRAGLVDFALGSDTAGSVRVPASFCGIYGMRPSHDRISPAGVFPFARSLDAAGWFARDSTLMRRVGDVLLDPPVADLPSRPGKFLLAEDAFAVVDENVRRALEPAVDRVADVLGKPEKIMMAGGTDLGDWARLIAVFREGEGWRTHREWIEGTKPRLSENGAMRMAKGSDVTDAQISAAQEERNRLGVHMASLLADGAILAVPAGPGVAPLRGGDQEAIWEIVWKNARINAVSALCGLPQISLPIASVDGLSMGLGLIAARGNDEMLLEIAETVVA